MSILANLKNISLAFGQKIIFKNTGITISKGDRIGLIGLNGQGKSTLFNILTETVKPDISQPAFIFDKNKEDFSIFLVPQELDIENFTDLTISDYYLAFYPNLLAIHRQIQDLETKISQAPEDEQLMMKNQDLLDQFELKGGWTLQNNYLSYLKAFELTDLNKSIQKLSGGERRKMALSIGLSAQEEFILWDEPTNHLDIETIEKFEDELMSNKKTFMVISHDRYFLNHITDKICHIDDGQISTFNGTYLDYLEYQKQKQLELMKNLDKLENRHRRELAWMRQGIKARGTRSKKRVEGYHKIKDDIANIKAKNKKATTLSLQHSGRKTKSLIDIQQGSFSYPDKVIFDNLELVVSKKDKIALIGPNGAGKSTLINILRQKLQLTDGHFKSAQDLKIVVFDQNRESLDLEKTPFEIVGDGVDFVTLNNGQQKHIHSYLESFLFTSDQVNRPISTLSGGEKNRLQLALFMKQSADLWVFDEPTNDLDIETIEILEQELREYQSAVIIIGHDRAFLDNICQKTWLIYNKEIEVFEGGYTQVAPYLHALEAQKLLEKNQASKKTEDFNVNVTNLAEPLEETAPKVKMTYNEKKRWDVIESEIENQELLIEQLQQELSEFDYQKSSPAQLEELNNNFESQKDKLDHLYQEWEDLSLKSY